MTWAETPGNGAATGSMVGILKLTCCTAAVLLTQRSDLLLSSRRNNNEPGYRYFGLGFRCVLELAIDR